LLVSHTSDPGAKRHVNRLDPVIAENDVPQGANSGAVFSTAT
jgi:hypothetical protein